MVELREGVWTRPDNLPRAAAPPEAWADGRRAVRVVVGAAPTPTRRSSRRALFAPDAWAARRRRCCGHLIGRDRAVVDGGAASAIADAFVVGAATLAHVRADPLLPAELCGADWPGDALRVGVPRVPGGVLGRGPRLVPQAVT